MGEEIEALWHRYRFVDLAFQDETFFTYRERVIAVAEEFLRRFAAPATAQLQPESVPSPGPPPCAPTRVNA